MSPHFHFRLDRVGYERCFELLAAAGMTFTEERRHVWEWSRWSPLITDIHGHLSTPHGTVACRLRSGTSYELEVTVLDADGLGALRDVEGALAGHVWQISHRPVGEALTQLLRRFRSADVRPRSEPLPVWDVARPGQFAPRRRRREQAVEDCRSRLLAALLSAERGLFVKHREAPEAHGVPGAWQGAGASTWLVPRDFDLRDPAVTRWLFAPGGWCLYRATATAEAEWPDLFRSDAAEVLAWMEGQAVEALIASGPDGAEWVVAARVP